jgi:proteasome assembly chaperone (PAC2) family protein
MKNQQKGISRLSSVFAMTTSMLIILFLSGKIIEIPHGTPEGGIMGATGVAVIIVSMGIVGIVIKQTDKIPKQ